MKSVVFLCYSYGLLALLDFLGTLLFLYNISRDSAPYEACFHTYFGIYWIFTASSKIVQQMHVKTALFLGHFQMYCQKVQLLPSYAGNKKTMIILTIAFVSCISWLRSGIERYADRKLSPCCQFFVSGFVGLLTYPFMHRGFSLLHKRIASAFSRSHDSPSNDRFSPRADFSARKTIL